MPRFTDPEEKFQWLTTASIPGLVGQLAVPTIISMLITSVYNMADTYFVGTLGKSAQGAVSVVLPLMAVIQAIGFTFGNGAGNNVSRLLGQQKREDAETVAATGFFSGVLAGLAILVLGELFLTPLVSILGATETILPYAEDYARYILIGAPWMIGSLVLNNLLRFSGSATYAMVGITVGGVLNIILDPIFIIVLEQGAAGAALATILSQLVSFFILLFNTGRGGNIPVRWSRIKWREGPLVNILKGGLPSLYRQGLASVSTILLNWAAKPFGDAAIAAMGIVSKVTMFSGSAVIGFGQGFQPVCGFNYGARLYHRVRDAYWFCIKVGTAFLIVMMAVVFFLAPGIVYRFQPGDAEVVRLGTEALRWNILGLPLLTYVIMNNMMLQTVGETGRASILAAARQGVFFIPAVLILPRFLEFKGVMMAQPTSDVCAFLLAIPLSVGFLRKMRGMEQAEKDLKKNE
ncbi:MATE family efflux transporter [Vermiculatibacterium agrestimuris]|uniref:MATE family efflux transporter n=1 Tax=Vermiculatibacterium agrestimuris TaxID=2941519 RepID=UPI002041ED93|nr:MATE family efflux transporter [Vermiculatibacterium agrestimuris]